MGSCLRVIALAIPSPSSSESEVRLSPSIMASEIHRIHPAAPSCQFVILPGAQPCARA